MGLHAGGHGAAGGFARIASGCASPTVGLGSASPRCGSDCG
jgi:hypothetical protein